MYVYDAFGALAAEYSSNSTPASVTCDRCYLSTDQVGSTRMVTDVSGNVVSLHDYLAFGGELDAGYAGRTSPWGSTADNVSALAAAELLRFSTSAGTKAAIGRVASVGGFMSLEVSLAVNVGFTAAEAAYCASQQ